ncbi:MAG: DNA recombination protein RmuC [Halobacteriales archaeon]|nr:DNA recombination protein RmuC [Halobacteriales archaeon]
MTLHEWLLPGASVLLLLLAVVLLVGLRRQLRDREGVDADTLSAALSRTWRAEGFDRALSDVERHAEQLESLHTDIAGMLRSPQARGEFGELQLEALLSDHLPPDMYGVREQVVDGRTPDAHIRSTAGLICIDAKFPLEQYQKAMAAETDADRERHQDRFASAVEGQLEKIAADYVRPDAGTADFAFAFIPSEAVYYHLVTEEYDLLRSFTKRGVQVVSPLTFGQKLELIKADVRSKRLSEQAETIRERLQRLGQRFSTLDDEWDTLRRHVRNASGKADDVERAYDALREEFERIERPAAAEFQDE